jgi:hypothetical protein
MNKVLLREKGLPLTGDINQPSKRETLVADIKEELKKPSESGKTGPSMEDLLDGVTEEERKQIAGLRSRQADNATPENIAAEAARNRPVGSFSRSQQVEEDLAMTGKDSPFRPGTRGTPMAEGQEGPE